jgi:AcrR family transcriptional regulator
MDNAAKFLMRKTSEGRLLRAAVDVINREGIDGASVGKVSAAAELTRPTFYAYFESMPGLLATMWMELGPAWLDMVSDLSSTPEQLDPARQQMHRAMIEILTAAHRMPEVLEVVQPTVADWWRGVQRDGQFHAEKVSWLVGQRIGSELTAPIDPEVVTSGIASTVLAGMPARSAMPDGRDLSGDLPELSGISSVTDDFDVQVIVAAIDVIARSGVKGASMIRVARRAQVSTGSIYPRFASLDEVIDRSFEHALRAVVADNLLRAKEAGTPADYGELIVAGLSPSRETWRNFRIEIHLVARHCPSLADRLAVSIKESNDVIITTSPYLRGIPLDVVSPLRYFIYALGIGIAVLHNTGIPIARLDHPRVSVEFGRSIEKLIG